MVPKQHPETVLSTPPSDRIMELSFMISAAQFERLQQAAQATQLTIAQYLRRLVQASLHCDPAQAPNGC
jgi:hypothetical protein